MPPQQSYTDLRRSLSPFPHPVHPNLIPHRERRAIDGDIVPFHRVLFPLTRSGTPDLGQFRVLRAAPEDTDLFAPLGYQSIERMIGNPDEMPQPILLTSDLQARKASWTDIAAIRTCLTISHGQLNLIIRAPGPLLCPSTKMKQPSRYVRPEAESDGPIAAMPLQARRLSSPCTGHEFMSRTNLESSTDDEAHIVQQSCLSSHIHTTTETRIDTVSSSGVHRFQRKMRDVDAYVVWYLSEGPEPLSNPHPATVANPGDLFIHRPVRGEEGQIWVVGKDGIWGEIAIGGKHPLLSGYRLHLLANRDPGWVTKKTATTYRGRQKRQANAL